MRPPHYAGENKRYHALCRRYGRASMRPPHYAGENHADAVRAGSIIVASMRPPHYAGENALSSARRLDDLASFNEAPALRGGKPSIFRIRAWQSSALQ